MKMHPFCARSRAHQRQGAALVIALFSLLTLTGLGLIAIQTATFEIRSSSNFRINKQAEYLSAGALNVVLGEVSQNADTYWSIIKGAAYETAETTSTNVALVNKQYVFADSSFAGKFFDAPTADLADVSGNFPSEMSVLMDDPLDGLRVPGYSESFCFKRFRFTSTASLGNPPSADAAGDESILKDSTLRYAEFSHMAYALVGPFECEGN